MNLLRVAFAILCLCAGIYANRQVENVTFTDMQGKSHDLHAILETGKYIYAHFSFHD